MILRAVVFTLLVSASLQERVFSSGVELEALPEAGGAIVLVKEEVKTPAKVKSSWWDKICCCSSKQVLGAIEETGRVLGDAAPTAVFAFGSAVLEDLADDGEINGSARTAYAKAVADTIRAFNVKGKASVVVGVSAGLADAAAQDLQDGKLNDGHEVYIKVLFREIERVHPGASAHEKEVSVLSSFILNLIEDLSDGKFDASGKEGYIRDFNALIDLLAEKVKDKPLLLSGLESAKEAFPSILTLDGSANVGQAIQIIQDALRPFHISNASTVQDKRQNLAVDTIGVVLKDAGDGKLDGLVEGSSSAYIGVVVDSAALMQNTEETKGDK